MDNITWDVAFAQLIRRDRSGYWGNWSLNAGIVPGAVGILDPATGTFSPTGEQLPGASTSSRSISQQWSVMSESVSRRDIKGGASGGGTDPETGTKVDAELTVAWTLEEKGSMVSEFDVTSEEFLDTSALSGKLSWLADAAARQNMASGGRISQGFGVVTSVIWADTGLNVAAQSSNTTFSVSGSVNAVNDLVGKGSGKGSYSYAGGDKSVNRHLWPDKPNTLSPGPVPIAYTFASFDGKVVLNRWTGIVNRFELLLNSVAGTTYIVDAKLTYETPGGKVEVKRTISGGLSTTIADIPLDATNLTLDVYFKGVFGDDHHGPFRWDTPLGQWAGGVRQIDLYGVWPGGTSATDVQGKRTL